MQCINNTEPISPWLGGGMHSSESRLVAYITSSRSSCSLLVLVMRTVYFTAVGLQPSKNSTTGAIQLIMHATVDGQTVKQSRLSAAVQPVVMANVQGRARTGLPNIPYQLNQQSSSKATPVSGVTFCGQEPTAAKRQPSRQDRHSSCCMQWPTHRQAGCSHNATRRNHTTVNETASCHVYTDSELITPSTAAVVTHVSQCFHRPRNVLESRVKWQAYARQRRPGPEPSAGSRGRAPSQGSGEWRPPEAESFFSLWIFISSTVRQNLHYFPYFASCSVTSVNVVKWSRSDLISSLVASA